MMIVLVFLIFVTSIYNYQSNNYEKFDSYSGPSGLYSSGNYPRNVDYSKDTSPNQKSSYSPSYVTSDVYSTRSSTNTTLAYPPSMNYNSGNYNVTYHDSVEDIQKQLGVDPSANLITVLDASKNLVQIPISQTMNDTTYYNEDLLKYDPSNYVPTYEDTIYFSKLTGLGYQMPIYGTDSQWGGFCSYNKYFPDKIEEKCGKLDKETCATTSCCVLLGGGTKCVAGNANGPYNKSNYNNLKKRDKYFFEGKCYGNCVDDQSNYYNYNREIFSKDDSDTNKLNMKTSPYDNTTNVNSEWSVWKTNASICAQQFPGCSDPCGKDASGYCVYQGPSGAVGPPPSSQSVGSTCKLNEFGNLLDQNKNIIARDIYLDVNNNFVNSNGQYVSCTTMYTPSPAPVAAPVAAPVEAPVAAPVASPSSIYTLSPTTTKLCNLFQMNPLLQTPNTNVTKCNSDPLSLFCNDTNTESCQPYKDLINNGKGVNNNTQNTFCQKYFSSLFSDNSFIQDFKQNWSNNGMNINNLNQFNERDSYIGQCKNISLT